MPTDNNDQDQPELTPEQQEQIEQALARARTAFTGISKVGCLGLIFRGFAGSFLRLPRFTARRFAAVGLGLLIVALSITTCSVGVNLANLTAQYGEPVPATKDAARGFVERAAAAIQNAPANRSFRISISDAEATSALSLGMMLPELTRALETVPRDELEQTNDIEQLRQLLREHETSANENKTVRDRVAALFNPNIRTGDVQVRFTGAGEIVAAGYVQAWRFQQPALVIFAPKASSGQLELDFVRGKLGRLPAPSWAFNLLGNLVASVILQGRDYAEISDITVEEGRLTFAARITR